MLDPARLVFIDETAVSTNMVRLRGRAPRGVRVIGAVPLGRWETITFVAALRHITVGEDKAYDTSDHIAALRRMNVTPHVAQNDSLTKTGKRRRSAIDARTTRHIGYQISQTCRKMAECIFGWGKQHGTMRKTKHRGIAAVAADFMLNLIAYNLVRIPKLIAA